MVLIHVPKPPKNAYDPNRPMGSLLESQIGHLRERKASFHCAIAASYMSRPSEPKAKLPSTFARSRRPFMKRMEMRSGDGVHRSASA